MCKSVISALSALHQKKISYDLENNSKKDLIWYELRNYETQISDDISEAVIALSDYGITEDEIEEEYKLYFKYCCKNDLF